MTTPRHTIFAVVGAMALAASAASAQVVKREAGYAPFVLVSSKTGRTMSSDFIEKNMVCKSPIETASVGSDLLKNFDLVDSAGDSSMSITTFRGRSNGKDVEVSLLNERRPARLKYVWINSENAIACKTD